MAIAGLNEDLLAGLAESGEPMSVERAGYQITIYVRRLESWEIGDDDPEPEYRTHPLDARRRAVAQVRRTG